jgi:hypothetical protein
MVLDESILLAARILGAGIFVQAAAGKWRHRDEYAGIVANYRIVPAPWVGTAAWTVLVLEVLVASSFASGIAMAMGGLVAIALLAGFAVAMGINILRGRTEIDCGCFQSAMRQRLSVALVVRNFFLSLAFAPLVVAEAAPESSVFTLLNGAACGVALMLVYLAFGELIATQHASQALRRNFR